MENTLTHQSPSEQAWTGTGSTLALKKLSFNLGGLAGKIDQQGLKLSIYLFFVFFAFSRLAPAAYGGSQARGLIRAVATGLHHSYSNAGSEPHLQPIPQLTPTPDPLIH